MMEDFSLPLAEDGGTSIKTSNSRTILHFDIDCFYAQVEMIKDPSLASRPLGIQQKNIVVTCNYIAREMGVVKCSYIDDARKVCPALVLVNGEDLAEYRKYSQKVFELIKRIGKGCPVERLGMDENFMDISKLVLDHELVEEVTGYTYGPLSNDDPGCFNRLKIGSKFAQKIRDEVFNELGITMSCGISWNKLLSKIVGTKNKPNKQTTLLPNFGKELIFELENLKKIPGIGSTTFKRLQENLLVTPEDIWNTAPEKLLQIFPESPDLAAKIRLLSEGIDDSIVKESYDKPLSIGLEDRFRPLVSEVDVEDKLKWLLNRLKKLLDEDGRLPKTFKVTVRDAHKDQLLGKHKFHKESRQCKINPKLFGNLQKSSPALDKKPDIVDIGMSLARKMINFTSKFQLTLLGVSVTDFVVPGKGIMSFFDGIKESKTDISSHERLKASDQMRIGCDIQNNKTMALKENDPVSNCNEGVTCNAIEINVNNSEERRDIIRENSKSSISEKEIPEDCDPEIFSQLPFDIQEELLNTNKCKPQSKDTNINEALPSPNKVLIRNENQIPGSWDNDVFNSLPDHIKRELMTEQNNVPTSSKGTKRSQNRIDHYFTKKCAKKSN